MRAKKKSLPPASDKDKKRGRISKFSNAAAFRLSTMLAELVITGPAVHASLTYPKTFPTSQAVIENHRHRLCTYLRRAGFFGVWKREFQRRGAVHYHIILWHRDDYDAEFHGQQIRDIWAQISGNDSDYAVSLTAGDASLATFYLALHHAKRDEQCPEGFHGRWWGYIDRAAVVEHRQVESLDLDAEQQAWLARLFRRRMASQARTKGRHWKHDKGLAKGFTFFLGQVDRYKLLRFINNREYEINGANKNAVCHKRIDGPITTKMLADGLGVLPF